MKKILKTLVLSIFLFNQFYILSKNTTEKCKILSLEGGGDRGAYQAGAFKAFVDNLDPDDVQYDIYSGISVGSLNSAGLSFFKKGDERNASDFLLKTWRNITSFRDIFQNYNFLSVFYSMFFEKGLFDSSPLKKMLKDIIDGHDVKRNFTFGMTNLGTGKYEIFTDENMNNMTKEDELLAILSSSAIPGVFPHIQLKNNTYVDGGLSSLVDLISGISICRDKGFSDENILVDIIMLSTGPIPFMNTNHTISITSGLRALDLIYYDVFFRGLDEVSHVFPNVKIRYLVIPSKETASGILPILFIPKLTEEMIEQGYNDAKKVIARGQGTVYKELREKYLEMKYKKILLEENKPKKFLS